MKRFFKFLLKLILILLLIVLAYVAYVFISYHRIGDKVIEPAGLSKDRVETGVPYKIMSWNIGFGAYEDDYGFFMDGGHESWAWSKERLNANLDRIASHLSDERADFYLIQEVDIDSTRSYHVDERLPLIGKMNGFMYTFAQNYDSPFLLYPFYQPHGASRSGIMVFSRYTIGSAFRKELPIERGYMKLLDLDRCYSVDRLPTGDGRELVLYNFHLSAYTSDGKIANEQLQLLLADMQSEYLKGNYCIGGGDFNKDILVDSSVYFGAADKEYTWAQPISEELFDGCDIELVAPLNEAHPVPSCRNADSAYHEGQYVLTIDGFLVSPNVKVQRSLVLDYGFAYSDHNPVTMSFTLNE